MQKTIPLLTLCLCFYLCGHSQFTRYIIRFKDKGSNPFSISNPSQYLTQRSLDRRTRYNIAIDSTDLPVTPRYIDSVRLSGNVTIINVSKWLNQVAIQTTDPVALNKINSFPFVISAMPLAAKNSTNPVNKKFYQPQFTHPLDISCYSMLSEEFVKKHTDKDGKISFPINYNTLVNFDLDNQLKLDYGDSKPGYVNQPSSIPATSKNNNSTQVTAGFYNYGQSDAQIRIHNGDFLHNHGFRGEGMQMVILDAGFYHYLSLQTFDSARNNNQILGTWDFVANEASVDEDYLHGMQCFSTIAANIPGTFVGTAPKASFYLYRTEDIGSEYPIEEQNWAVGIERADSLGVDISSTSLGYSTFDNALLNHTYADMDGNTTISAKAADLAARKGILVVCAAGNEGNNLWHYLITPSDADSALCVGAVDVSGNVAGFSSYGPSSDGQVKPAVAAVGLNAVVANPNNGLPGFNSGTSFACPNMAGITTCLWQAFPEISNMGIIEALEASASRSNNPDDRSGYGIPDAKKAFVILLKKLYSRQSAINGCNMDLQFNVKTDNTMIIDVERKGPNDAAYSILPASLISTLPYALHGFSFSDPLENLVTGNYQYRLKMTIGTDTTFYLDSILVNYVQACAAPSQNAVAIGPNPATDHINVIITRITDSKVDIVIRNAIGQKVYSNSFEQQAGIHINSIPMQGFSKGVYFLTVYIDSKKETTKKIVRQ